MPRGHSYVVEEDEICELRTRLTALLTDLELARRRLLVAKNEEAPCARVGEIVQLNDDALANAERACTILKRRRAAAERGRSRHRTVTRAVLFVGPFRSGV